MRWEAAVEGIHVPSPLMLALVALGPKPLDPATTCVWVTFGRPKDVIGSEFSVVDSLQSRVQ